VSIVAYINWSAHTTHQGKLDKTPYLLEDSIELEQYELCCQMHRHKFSIF